MKIELGKTYRNRKGKEVKITLATGHRTYPFRGDNGYTYSLYGSYDLSKYDDLDLIAEVPAKVDLTNITTPFGLLNETTQEALKTHEGPWEMYDIGGWTLNPKPMWSKCRVYRVKRMPVVVKQKVHQALWGIDLIITATAIDGVIDESSFKIEVNK